MNARVDRAFTRGEDALLAVALEQVRFPREGESTLRDHPVEADLGKKEATRSKRKLPNSSDPDLINLGPASSTRVLKWIY